MKKLLQIRHGLLLALMLFSATLMAQNTIRGVLMDATEGEPLIGASVLIQGTSKGTVTDWDGSFELTGVEAGIYTLVLSYTGYATQEMDVDVSGDLDLGTVNLDTEVIGLAEVNVIASYATDRKTPVAVSTIKGKDIEVKVGNQEYPELLRKTPSIYVTKEGGGFGDSRINVRGFDQRNTAVMINGIPVNDMENGWVYWSNWAGLGDVTSSIQVQRGLGASKLAVASVGGSINIVTNAALMEKGASASVTIGNDAYQKYAVAVNSGLSEKGWAFSLQGTHTQGDGYVDGTAFRAWSYFLGVTKQFNANNMLSLTVVGAPQWHHQRLIAGDFDNITLRTYRDPDGLNEAGTDLGIKYNHTWGTLNGEEFNWRRNFYHKPKAFLNHYWTLSPKTDIKTSAYVSLGRGGGTGPRGRLRTPGSVFDSFSGLGQGTHNANGLVRFDDIVAYNQGQSIADWGSKEINPVTGNYLVGEDGRIYYDAAGNIVNDSRGDDVSQDNTGSGFIRRASMNSHNWFGVLSTLTSKLNESFTLIGGLDWRYYKGIHYRRVENLLGADAYSSKSNINNPGNIITTEEAAEFGSFGANGYKEGNNVLNYYNDGLVNWLGLFTQLEYSANDLSAFVSLSGSNQGFKRVDYFNYLDSDPEQTSDWENFLGGTVKAGLNYNIDESHNVFVNAGHFSRQPIFDNVFINFVNNVNENVKNQTVTAFELGYGFRSSAFNAKVNLYSTTWGNRQFDRTLENANGEDVVFQFENVSQRHVGIEVEADYSVTRNFNIVGMLSIGDWKYSSNFSARGQNIDTQQPEGEGTIYADGLPVGDAAQTTFNIGVNYGVAKGLNFYADYYVADRLYADYDVDDSQFSEPGGTIVKLPSYSLVDAGISYNFALSTGIDASLRFNMNNVLDTKYVSELETNILDDPSTSRNEFYDNKGIWAFGRTWNVGLKLFF